MHWEGAFNTDEEKLVIFPDMFAIPVVQVSQWQVQQKDWFCEDKQWVCIVFVWHNLPLQFTYAGVSVLLIQPSLNNDINLVPCMQNSAKILYNILQYLYVWSMVWVCACMHACVHVWVQYVYVLPMSGVIAEVKTELLWTRKVTPAPTNRVT